MVLGEAHPPTWKDEVALILAQAQGDVALFVALCALRKTENGPPGNAFGVMSIRDVLGKDAIRTYAEELRVAARSFRNREREWEEAGLNPRDLCTGLFLDAFLAAFSARWAPTKGATNDPTGLNAHHVPNLLRFAKKFGEQVVEALGAIR